MVLANSKTHIEPLDTFHDAGAHDLDILLKGTIVPWQEGPAEWGIEYLTSVYFILLGVLQIYISVCSAKCKNDK